MNAVVTIRMLFRAVLAFTLGWIAAIAVQIVS